MITHNQARRLLATIDTDASTKDRLAQYINGQERGPAEWENLSDRDHSVRAAQRAVEAISRVATLTTDLGAAEARIASLEASVDELRGIVMEVLGLMDSSD